MSEKQELLDIVDSMYDKYHKNTIVFSKFLNYIQEMPSVLENINNTMIQREKRKSKLESDSEKFIKKFLYNNKIYYNTSSEIFFQYKNNKYLLIKEDDVQHLILTSITSQKSLADWKQKLKVSILKKIKEQDIFTCIPESETIQNIISKLQTCMFNDKEKVKYFLTMIGDMLLKKCSLHYFIHSKVKPFLKELTNLSCMWFSTPILLNNFKFKYYDHKFSDCRLVDLIDFFDVENCLVLFKNDDALNLFCVAVYYSNRYENADNYLLNHCKNDSLRSYAFYLKNNNDKNIVDNFLNKYIEKREGSNVTWKNMQYIWKLYVENEKIPNIFFSSSLKNQLIKEIEFDIDQDFFLDCTSIHLPRVSKFLQFWNEQIIISEQEELELDELSSLFSFQCKTNLNEKDLLDLIKHYYSDICIEDEKFLLNIKCKIWDKKKDIIELIKNIKKEESLQDIEELPIFDIYKMYSKCKKKFIVSKQYFEKFIKEEYFIFIIDENFFHVKTFLGSFDSLGNIK